MEYYSEYKFDEVIRNNGTSLIGDINKGHFETVEGEERFIRDESLERFNERVALSFTMEEIEAYMKEYTLNKYPYPCVNE